MDRLSRFRVDTLRGGPAEAPKKRVAPSAMLPLELTARERELILERSLAPDELTRRLRIVPPPGKEVIVRYTLDDLDELAGYVAFESNHAKQRKLQREWEGIYGKIAAILGTHTGEE